MSDRLLMMRRASATAQGIASRVRGDDVPAWHPETSYLDAGLTLGSWLTTHDHKRIAILYALSITAFFFIGGGAATLIRIELVFPAGKFMSADTYNKLFTMHGVIMVWFFLIPSIPATLGNFLVPLMIGARDLAFPRLNLASWYLYVAGGIFTLASLVGVESTPDGRSIRRSRRCSRTPT
jgi:cytochrome c oxidase subunit 1